MLDLTNMKILSMKLIILVVVEHFQEMKLVFSLNLENTVEQQSIQGLLNKMLDPHGHQILEYKCEMKNGIGCNKKGCCTKSTSITDIKDTFII